MRKLMVVAAAATLGLGLAAQSYATCTAVCDEVCGVSGATHTFTSCSSPSPDNPPSGPCGELCLTDLITGDATDAVPPVDELLLVAGGVNQDDPASTGGCVGLLGGTLHSGMAGTPPAPPDPTASYETCKIAAATGCEEQGCAVTTAPAAGQCPAGSIVRSSNC